MKVQNVLVWKNASNKIVQLLAGFIVQLGGSRLCWVVTLRIITKSWPSVVLVQSISSRFSRFFSFGSIYYFKNRATGFIGKSSVLVGKNLMKLTFQFVFPVSREKWQSPSMACLKLESYTVSDFIIPYITIMT